jgi:hypothetical protein
MYMVLLSEAGAAVLAFCSLQLRSMSKFLATSALCVRAFAIGVTANAAVITAGVGVTFVIATIVSEDQRAYNSCMFKHKSADYCRLIVSGR